MPGPLQFHGQRAEPAVLKSIADASRKSGVSFSFLVAQADMESGLKVDAKAETSSAAGLFQFIEQTWLGMMREHGNKIGHASLSRQIEVGSDGRLKVADADAKRQILELRNDARAAAAMGAEYARSNGAVLQDGLGREPRPVDLYLAHFLGPSGAVQFLRAMQVNPDRPAAQVLPQAAQANRGVFFGRDGQAASLQQVYRRFETKLSERMSQVAGAPPIEAPPPRQVADARSRVEPFFGSPPATQAGNTALHSNGAKRPYWSEPGALANLPTTWLLQVLGVLPNPQGASEKT